MINGADRDDLCKIVIINPKGGCGKTTLATNLASSYARRGPPPTLIDYDPKGFCIRWLQKRSGRLPTIHGIDARHCGADSLPLGEAGAHPESNTVLFDLPASIRNEHLHHYTYVADRILIPVTPSAIDVYSATRFIAHLLLDQQIDRREHKLGIIANRVRSNTKSYDMLTRFLSSLEIPVIAELRDSQNFVFAAANGIGICDMPGYRAKADIGAVERIVDWLQRRRAPARTALTEDERQTLIAQVAYRRAESRGFRGGDPTTDWLEAEREVDATYGGSADP